MGLLKTSVKAIAIGSAIMFVAASVLTVYTTFLAFHAGNPIVVFSEPNRNIVTLETICLTYSMVIAATVGTHGAIKRIRRAIRERLAAPRELEKPPKNDVPQNVQRLSAAEDLIDTISEALREGEER